MNLYTHYRSLALVGHEATIKSKFERYLSLNLVGFELGS